MRYRICTVPAVAALACAFAHPTADSQPPSTQGGTPVPFARARALHKAGKHAEALAALDADYKALPAGARLSRWAIDFKGWPVPVVLIGTRHLYFTTTCSRHAKPSPPALPDTRAVLTD